MEDILKQFNLDTNKDLTALAFKDEEDWLELRTKGIGGSDVGAIMGLNKYTSALQIYKAKVLGQANDVSDKPAVRKGKDLEPVIRANYFRPMMEQKNFELVEVPYILINSKYPWLRANLDGIAFPKDVRLRKHTNNVVCEIKVVTEYAEVNWFGEEYCGIPASYYAQVQEYMLVTDASYAILGALFEKNWEMHYFKIPADKTFQEELIRKSKEFYEYNMTLKNAPKLNPELDKEDIIEGLIKTEAVPTRETEEITESARKYRELNKEIKALEDRKKLVLTDITNRYLDGERSNDSSVKIKFTVTSRTSLDITRIKEEEPEIYQKYSKVSESSTPYIR